MSDPVAALKVHLFGLTIDALEFPAAVELLTSAVTRRPAQIVVTPNVDHLVNLSENAELQAIYASADFVFADGMPLVWASRLLGKPLPTRVTGADLFVALCEQGVVHGWHVAVVGGVPGQEDMLLARFAAVFPGLRISLHCPKMGFDYHGTDGLAAAAWVNQITPDLVFVCLGFPRQDLWAFSQRQNLNTGLLLGVGASMEFALGLIRRAPRWMQRSGLEWAWRLGSNPRKLWRRYLVRGPRFLTLLWREWRQA
jgi:N-acetylglucosaminyldiphosphoundecaprenol N-acetyl-beta-D-mannosaminyltransferase